MFSLNFKNRVPIDMFQNSLLQARFRGSGGKKICLHMNLIFPEKLFILKSPSIEAQFNICTRHLRPQKGLQSTTFVLHKNIVEFT